MTDQIFNPTYGPLDKVCKSNGICRTVAFDLAARGILETFKIGNRRYVYLDSVRTLPERLKELNP